MESEIDKKGYIHLYTGNGKGKTTAAFGLALRALCAGKRVYIGQFVKSMRYNETSIVDHFDNVTVEQLGIGCFLESKPNERDREVAEEGLERCRKVIESGDFDLVVLDELTIAIYMKLLTTESVLQLLELTQPHPEIVITGRYAPQELIERADLVTDMREIKHYYQQGVLSRDGIDK